MATVARRCLQIAIALWELTVAVLELVMWRGGLILLVTVGIVCMLLLAVVWMIYDTLRTAFGGWVAYGLSAVAVGYGLARYA